MMIGMGFLSSSLLDEEVDRSDDLSDVLHLQHEKSFFKCMFRNIQ